MGVDDQLIAETAAFANDIRDLLHNTVSPNPDLTAEAVGRRVVVASHDTTGEVGVPLHIDREQRLDLRLLFRCTWDSAGRFLAIDESKVDIAAAQVP